MMRRREKNNAAPDPQKPTVWMVANPHRRVGDKFVPIYETRTAENFGKRRILIEDAHTHNPANSADVIPRMRETLTMDYNAESDLLMLIGPPAYAMMAGIIVADLTYDAGFEYMRVLYWQNREHRYRSILLPIKDMLP